MIHLFSSMVSKLMTLQNPATVVSIQNTGLNDLDELGLRQKSAQHFKTMDLRRLHNHVYIIYNWKAAIPCSGHGNFGFPLTVSETPSKHVKV